MNFVRVFAITEKYLIEFRRDIFRVFDIFWWPAFQLFVWGFFSIYLRQSGNANVNIVSILLGAVMLWSFFDRASRDIALAFMIELWTKNLLNLFSSPLRISEYLLGVMIMVLIRLLVGAVFMVLLATVFYAFRMSSIGWYIIPAFLGLTIMGWSLSLITQGCILRYGKSVEVFVWAAATLVQPFSCVFYPLTILPQWAQKIALLLPSTYFFESMRSVMTTGSFDTQGVLIGFALNIVYFILAIMFVYSSFAAARVRGSLVKHYY